jgi:hypothetical protein
MFIGAQPKQDNNPMEIVDKNKVIDQMSKGQKQLYYRQIYDEGGM